MPANRKLTIDVVVDSTGAVRKLKAVQSQVNKVGSTAKTAGAGVTGLGGSLKSAAALGLGFVGVTTVLAGVSNGIRFAARAAIEMNAQIETSTLQFKALMGDAGAAEQRVRELFNFAKSTPFESGPIIEAARIMRTFGGAALDTQENLFLIGDAAAATAAPINELGMWTGRLFAALQGGQPIGEATLRMMELGVVTPQVVQKLRDMREAGASANEIFDVFRGELGKFTGSMEDQSQTWAGVTSTFWENVKLFIAEKSTPAFEGLKGAIMGANEAFDDLNKGPLGRAAEQYDSLLAAQARVSEQMLREIRLYGEVTQQTRFNFERRRDLIATIKEQEAASRAAQEAQEAETQAQMDAAEAAAAAEQAIKDQKKATEEAEEAAKKFADMVDRLAASEAALSFQASNVSMSLEDQLSAFESLDSELLEVTQDFSFLAATTLPWVKDQLMGLRKEVNPPERGGFFGGMLDSFEGLKKGLTGENGLEGFFTKLGTGVVEGFGNIISGGLTSLVNALVAFLAAKIGQFLAWLGGKIAGFFKSIGRGILRLFGVGGGAPLPTVESTMDRMRRRGNPNFDPNDPFGGFVPTDPTGGFGDEGDADFSGFFARGGPVRRMARGGFTDTVPALLTPGEFVLSRPAVQRLGQGGLSALNSNRGGSGGGLTVSINGGMFFDSPTTRRQFADWIGEDLMRQLGQRRRIEGLV